VVLQGIEQRVGVAQVGELAKAAACAAVQVKARALANETDTIGTDYIGAVGDDSAREHDGDRPATARAIYDAVGIARDCVIEQRGRRGGVNVDATALAGDGNGVAAERAVGYR